MSRGHDASKETVEDKEAIREVGLLDLDALLADEEREVRNGVQKVR